MPSKRNSFDRQHELLASSKALIETLGPLLTKHNEDPAAIEWHPATAPYRRLKAAVAECEANQ